MADYGLRIADCGWTANPEGERIGRILRIWRIGRIPGPGCDRLATSSGMPVFVFSGLNPQSGTTCSWSFACHCNRSRSPEWLIRPIRKIRAIRSPPGFAACSRPPETSGYIVQPIS